MPFEKGKSGNPSGRPKAAAGLRAELDRRYGSDSKTLLDKVDKLTTSKNERVRLDALKVLLAYHVGQPTQRIEHDDQSDRMPAGGVQFIIQEAPDSRNRT